MPWVVDPELQKQRQKVLDLLSLARAETSFMESACEDLLLNTTTLVAGVPLGDKAVNELRSSISHIQAATTNTDSARRSAWDINIMKWEPPEEEEPEAQSSYSWSF